MKGNPQKKEVFQDNFIKHWCCSSDNHPEGWSWWKKKTRKDFRHKEKQNLKKDILDAQFTNYIDSMGCEYTIKNFN